MEHPVKLNTENAKQIIQDYDLLLDCSDNSETRYVLDAICSMLKKPWIYTSVGGFEGQLSVFNYRSGYKYSTLFSNKEIFKQINSCESQGVISATCNFASSLQIAEVLKIVLSFPEVSEGVLLAFNILHGQLKKYNLFN